MDDVLTILSEAKLLAQRYRRLTGKPLGVTGECAEFEAATILGLALAPARTAGYDATEDVDGKLRKLQIKGRCILPGASPGQRIGAIDVAKEFDAVLLVLLDQNLDAMEIIEANRDKVIAALSAPGSKARNERGALGIAKSRAIGTTRWKRGQ